MHVYVKSARSEAEDTAQREEDVVVGFIMGERSWASQGRGGHHAYYDNTRKEKCRQRAEARRRRKAKGQRIRVRVRGIRVRVRG